LRWCAPALLLLVALVAQPSECPVGHHQLHDAAVAAAPVSTASFSSPLSAVPVLAETAVPDFGHGPICHESSAGDLLWTHGRPARTSAVKTAYEPTSTVGPVPGAPAGRVPATSPGSVTASSGRAILLAIGVARG
jgi:hypothetical protein